jgi:hypothetical protein
MEYRGRKSGLSKWGKSFLPRMESLHSCRAKIGAPPSNSLTTKRLPSLNDGPDCS